MNDKNPPLSRIILLSCVAALGGFLFGYDSGVINGTVNALQNAFGASDAASGFNVASMLLGCAGGAFFAGRIADRFGRKTALFTAALLFGMSAWGSGIATSSAEFVVYRLIGGFAVGAASVISPAYISEIAPAHLRGRLATLQQMAIVLGLFFAFVSNYLIAGAAGGASEVLAAGYQAWQFMFWAELIPIALFFIGLLFIPESPRYLVAAGKPERAQKVLASVSHPDDAASKVASIRRTLKADHRPRMSDLRLDEGGGIRPIVWVGLCIAALQQLVGINVVFYYGEVLWRAAGFSEGDALLINVIGGFINVSATVGAILLVDKWGRNVPQSDPGCCTLRGGSLPMADQLRRDHDLPHPAWSHRPRRCLRHLLRLRDSGSALCLEIRARDQGQDPRGNVMAARFFIASATICDTDGRFW